MNTTIQPTRQALRLHRSHLATTHRAPLVPHTSSAVRARATAFTPMAPEGVALEKPRHEIHTQTHES